MLLHSWTAGSSRSMPASIALLIALPGPSLGRPVSSASDRGQLWCWRARLCCHLLRQIVVGVIIVGSVLINFNLFAQCTLCPSQAPLVPCRGQGCAVPALARHRLCPAMSAPHCCRPCRPRRRDALGWCCKLQESVICIFIADSIES